MSMWWKIPKFINCLTHNQEAAYRSEAKDPLGFNVGPSLDKLLCDDVSGGEYGEGLDHLGAQRPSLQHLEVRVPEASSQRHFLLARIYDFDRIRTNLWSSCPLSSCCVFLQENKIIHIWCPKWDVPRGYLMYRTHIIKICSQKTWIKRRVKYFKSLANVTYERPETGFRRWRKYINYSLNLTFGAQEEYLSLAALKSG